MRANAMSMEQDPADGILYGNAWAKNSPSGRVDVVINNTWHSITREEAKRLRDSLVRILGASE